MALITKIRKNLWLVLVLLGLALAAFILMDMTSSQNMGGQTQFNVGEVNGETISWADFQNAENVLYSGSAGNIYGKREALWNYMVRSTIFEQEAEEVGINVTDEEMEELQFGNNISPVIQRNFADPNTGQLNIEALNNFRQGLEAGTLPPQSLRFWEFQEGQIRADRIQSKLQTLVTKGMYMPEWHVTKRHFENNNKLDFLYVKVPFEEVDDSQVTITDEDLQAYIEENPGLYSSDEETRNVVYVSFGVEPTAGDTAEIVQILEDLRKDFETIEDDSLFVENNYGQIEDIYYKKGILSSYLQDTIEKMEVGGIVGPYQDGGSFKVAKLLDQKVIPDSVEVRHILRSVTDQASFNAANALIDSLKNVIENGANTFDSLAVKFSQDPGSGAKGGDLGFTSIGRMVPQFNNLIFYKAEPRKLYKVATQFGIHLVEVTNQKFLDSEPSYRVAYLQEAIVPSQETQDIRYDEVSQFVAANRTYTELEATVNSDPDLEFKLGNGLTENSYGVGDLPEVNSSRSIVQWAFENDNEPGDVSPEVYTFQDEVNYFNNQYVVVALTAINEPGLATVATVRDEVTAQVMKEKKGEIIKSQISGTDLSAIAQQFNTTVDSAKGAVFISGFVPGVGAEPKVIGTAFSIEDGATAGPIVGNGGVFYVKRLSLLDAFEPNNIAQLRKVNSSQNPTRVNNNLSDALMKMVPIEDQRSKYY
jgi:peptidyl-prolyl cis-trans isomerase D